MLEKMVLKIALVAIFLVVSLNLRLYAFGISSPSKDTPESVWVVRSDGAKSCSQELSETLDDGMKTLEKAGIRVFESAKGHDGAMHVQVCGAETGSLNAYRILAEQLNQVLQMGYSMAPVNFTKK